MLSLPSGRGFHTIDLGVGAPVAGRPVRGGGPGVHAPDGDRLAADIALNLLAQGALAAGEFARAGGYFRDALEVTFEVSDRPNAAFCLQGLAAVAEAHDDGDPAHAARLLGAAEVLLESAGGPRYAMVDQNLHRRVADTTRARLRDRAWDAFVFDGEDPARA